jgi:hypothetical protein
LENQRQTSFLPWLAQRIYGRRQSNATSSAPNIVAASWSFVAAACEETFADSAHPARRVLEEWRHWAPGWQECLGIEGVVPEYCRELSTSLSELLLQKPEH